MSAIDRLDELRSITTKIRGKCYDLYLHVGWQKSCPVYVDLRLAPHPHAGEASDSAVEIAFHIDQLYFINSALEMIVRQSSALLQGGGWTLEDLCDAWRGTTVFYGGACSSEELQFPHTTGPLDAAARVIQARQERWRCQMTG
jgi:hypothetical protein